MTLHLDYYDVMKFSRIEATNFEELTGDDVEFLIQCVLELDTIIDNMIDFQDEQARVIRELKEKQIGSI